MTLEEIQEREQEFRDKCKKCLPEYISANGFTYKISANMLFSADTFRISYGEFDGNFFNWNNKHLDLFYTICDTIPEKKTYKPGELQDATIYLASLDDVISDCIKRLNKFTYEKLDAIEVRCGQLDEIGDRWARFEELNSGPKLDLPSPFSTYEKELFKIEQIPKTKSNLSVQLTILKGFAEKLGLYDADDFIANRK